MTIGAPADEQSYRTVVDFLRRVKRRMVQRAIAVALTRVATLLALGIVLWVGLEALLFFSPFWRTLGAWMIAGSGLVLFVVDTILQLRGKRSLHEVALFVEHRCPDFRQRLITTLELLPGKKGALHSSELLSATAISAADMAAQTKPRGVVDDDRLRSRLRHLGTVGGISLALCGMLRGDMIPALDRCLHPTRPYVRVSATTVTSLTGDLEIVKGDDAVVHFRVRGEVPPSARILSRESPQMPWREIEEIVLPAPTASDSLRYVFAGVRRPLTYVIEAGDGASQPARIDVLESPVVQQLQVRYAFPPYTGLPDRIDEVSGDVRAIIGTRVDLEIISSKSLSTAAVVVDDSLRLPAQITDTRAHIAWYLSADTTGQGLEASYALDAPRVSGSHYHVELTDHRGIRNRDPIRYAIRPLFDEVPRIAVTEPGRDADLPEDLHVVLGLEAQDDFGVAGIDLVYRVNDGDDNQMALSGGGGRELTVIHAWDLNGLELLPDDLVHYHAQVSDNDLVSGPKKGRSREFTFRYPSLYELMTELSETRSDQIEALNELMAEDDEETAEFVEQIRRELLKKEELSWQQRKELEATIEQQQERATAVSELARQMEETMQAMQESGLASEEILDKLDEIRELMQEVTSPELQEALQSLQDAMQDIEPQELAEALADFAADHEAFQQRLDRTLALLRQVDLEQRLEDAVSQAQDLHSRQELIDEAMKEQSEGPKLQKQEARLSEDTQSLQQELSELADDARPYDEEAANELERHAQSMQENRLSGRMKELSAQLGSQRQQAQARQLGEDLEEELGALSSGLEQIQQEFVASQKQDLLRALKQAMGSLVALSFNQEDLLNRSWNPTRPTEALPELADEQFALLNGTGALIDQLAEVGRKTVNLNLGLPTTLGHVLQSMKQAASLLGGGDGARSAPHQQKALKSMNEAALLLRESADDIRNSRTPSGFGEAMEKMMGLSEQQAALNQATQESLGQGTQLGKEGRPGQDWRSQMGRLAREQRRIQSALSELERGLRGHRGARKQLAEIDREMATALSEMRRRNPSARLGQSQQRILQRMLDASRSVNTRGFKQERISESAMDPGTYVGPWLPADLGQAPDELREAMKRALSGDYPHEYWDVIRRYYELVYEDVARERASPGEGSSLP